MTAPQRLAVPALLLLLSTPLLLSTRTAQAVDVERVDICHVDAGGEVAPLRVPRRIVQTHMDAHGDWRIEDEVCGDGLDNDCDGAVDEACCPFFDDFGGLPDVDDYDVSASGGVRAYDHEPETRVTGTTVNFSGTASDGTRLVFSYWFQDYGSAYEALWGMEASLDAEWAVFDDAAGTWTGSPSTVSPITDARFAACTEAAFAWAEQSGLSAVDERDGL